MKRQGFTLIELLVVIIIMGILVTITTIIVSDIIENSEINSAISSAEQIIKAVTIDYTAKDNFTTEELNILSFNFEGEKPEYGYIQFNENEKVRLYMLKDEYCVTKTYDSELVATKIENGEICDWNTGLNVPN